MEQENENNASLCGISGAELKDINIAEFLKNCIISAKLPER